MSPSIEMQSLDSLLLTLALGFSPLVHLGLPPNLTNTRFHLTPYQTSLTLLQLAFLENSSVIFDFIRAFLAFTSSVSWPSLTHKREESARTFQGSCFRKGEFSGELAVIFFASFTIPVVLCHLA